MKIPTATRLKLMGSAIDNLGYWLPKMVEEIGGTTDPETLEKAINEAGYMYSDWLFNYLEEKFSEDSLRILSKDSELRQSVYTILMEMFMLKVLMEGIMGDCKNGD